MSEFTMTKGMDIHDVFAVSAGQGSGAGDSDERGSREPVKGASQGMERG